MRNIGEPLVGRLLLIDALTMDFRMMKVRRDPACPLCGDAPSIHELIDYDQFCGTPPLLVPEEALEAAVGETAAAQAGGAEAPAAALAEPVATVKFTKRTIPSLRKKLKLSRKDLAQLLGVSPRTVEADWAMARAWLREELAQ